MNQNAMMLRAWRGTAVAVVLAMSGATTEGAERRCEWVGPPASVTMWSPWALSTPGTLWDTQSRFCTTTETGPATWYTVVVVNGRAASFGVSEGGGVSAGYTWTRNEVITPGSKVAANGVAVQRVREDSCVFTSSTVLSMNVNLNQTIGSSANLSNRWNGATVTWDGVSVSPNASINLRNQVGAHSYVVSRTDGVNTQTLNFAVNVTPDFTFTTLGYGDTPNGSRWMRFTNNSPDAIDTVFTSASGWVGTSTDIRDTFQHVAAGTSVDLLVNFYTNPGYVVADGDHPAGTVFARFGTTDGEVLASSAVVVPAPGAAWAGVVLGLGLARRRRRR